MAQGSKQINANVDIISSTNSDQLDAFSNTRTADPTFVADGQLTYDLQPLLYEQITAGDGTIVHDATERAARLRINTATGSGDQAIMQQFQPARYQAGRAQEIFITFNFNDNTGVNLLRRFAEYGDGDNAIGFDLGGAGGPTTKSFYIIKNGLSTGIAQAVWNIDPLDGTGPSGITLDTSKTQILVISIQALYVGEVRLGFDIDGDIIWCHEFKHANVETTPYIQTANLPVRVGMESLGATLTDDDMLFVCSCVLSRGGQERIAGFDFSVKGQVTAASGARTHLLSVRPKTTFNSITNRVEFVLEDISLLNTGTNPIYWELCLGQALTAASYSDSNSNYSSFEYAEAETLSGSPEVVFASGFTGAANNTEVAINQAITNRYPISLDASGSPRDLGTLTLLVTGLGGTSACQGQIHWKELR